jgi:hypothetical protein
MSWDAIPRCYVGADAQSTRRLSLENARPDPTNIAEKIAQEQWLVDRLIYESARAGATLCTFHPLCSEVIDNLKKRGFVVETDGSKWGGKHCTTVEWIGEDVIQYTREIYTGGGFSRAHYGM